MNEDLRLSYLFRAYCHNEASAEEVKELNDLLAARGDDELAALLQAAWDDQNEARPFFTEKAGREMLATILPPYTIPFWKKYARLAAAAVLVLALGGSYLWMNRKDGKQVAAIQPLKGKDIAPGQAGAILTLGDGRQVVLDSALNGTVTNEGGSHADKEGNTLSYHAAGDAQVVYNTMTTPRGRQYHLQLADGSDVWLNAESSIRFPTAFKNAERRVEITGEAYFEIARDASKKFLVTTNGVTTEVLGTHFNVNAYDDEATVNVTLLEGAVRVGKGGNQRLLKPGQQARIKEGITVDEHADTESATAWKNGRFQFNEMPIGDIMRQVARWYDIDLVFEGEIKGTFVADISRDEPISGLLHLLELTDRVHFDIEGKKVTVKP